MAMAMAKRSGSRPTWAMWVVVLFAVVVVGSCRAEQLVGTTHPAPTLASLQLGLDVATSLAATPPYYISYGALDANRAPCPAGTGRSYYTQSCQGSGAVQPYARSCTAMARCARG